MKQISKILLGLALTAPAFAQNVLSNTTLTSSITAFATNVCVASATNIVVPSLAAGVQGSFLMVQSEVMRVQAAGTSSTCFNVYRGIFATELQGAASFHGNGAKVWVLGQNISTGDPSRPISTTAFLSQRPYQPFEVMSTPTLFGVSVLATAPNVANSYRISTLEVDINALVSGACLLNGSGAQGTDKRIYYLWDAEGNVLANTTLAGTTDATSSQYQCISFTSPIALVGPAQYFIGFIANGSTDTYSAYNTGSTHSSFPTATQAGTFGTSANISTVPTTFTAAVGPVMVLF